MKCKIALANRLEQLQNSPEKQSELSQRDIESKIEKARNDALEKASNAPPERKRDYVNQKRTSSVNTTQCYQQKRAKQQLQTNTIKQVQSELPTGNRIFSKFIHNNVVEKTSDIIGNTIARPNAILVWSYFCFLLDTVNVHYRKDHTVIHCLVLKQLLRSRLVGYWELYIDYLRILFTGNK